MFLLGGGVLRFILIKQIGVTVKSGFMIGEELIIKTVNIKKPAL